MSHSCPKTAERENPHSSLCTHISCRPHSGKILQTPQPILLPRPSSAIYPAEIWSPSFLECCLNFKEANSFLSGIFLCELSLVKRLWWRPFHYQVQPVFDSQLFFVSLGAFTLLLIFRRFPPLRKFKVNENNHTETKMKILLLEVSSSLSASIRCETAETSLVKHCELRPTDPIESCQQKKVQNKRPLNGHPLNLWVFMDSAFKAPLSSDCGEDGHMLISFRC